MYSEKIQFFPFIIVKPHFNDISKLINVRRLPINFD